MRSIKKALTVLLCTSLIANNTSYIMALDFTESNAESENTQILRLDGEIQNIKWTTPDSINLGEKFDAMSGVKALDKDGKDITDKIKVNGNVDTSKPGEYKIEYFIQGEEDKKISRTIKVLDKNNQDESSTETVLKTEITGPQIVSVYQGDNFDIKSNIKSTDEKGKDITSKVQVEGTVDTNKLGEYKLKYLVNSDSGQKAILERTVKVIEKNVFNFYINKDDKNVHEKPNPETKVTENGKKVGFSLYLDLNTSKFVVNNQSQEMLDKTKPKEVYANIAVLDKNNKEKLALELLGKDTGNSTKFDKLKELGYEYGDFIQISLSNPKENFDISGKLSGDVITEKVDENTIIQEDYKDGVDNIDYIQNVRFKIVEEGIESIYNNAPKITGLEVMENLLTDRNKQLEGIKVTDDHDGDIPNDKIQISEEKDDKNNIIGLRYTVSDSWGRNISQVRYVDNSKVFTNNNNQKNSETTVNTSLSDNIIEVHGIEYQDNRTLRFKMNFNQDDMKIYFTDRNDRLLDNKIKDKYFEIILYDKFGKKKETLILNGNDKGSSKKIDEFEKVVFEYGDQIHIFHHYSDTKLKIKGSVQGKGSEYNNGTPKNDLEIGRFELTQTGLKYLTNNPPEITWSNQTLTITRGERVNLLKDVVVNDDMDGIISNARVSVSDYSPNRLGTQTVTYTVKDSWGATTTKERSITITSDSALANTSIDVMKVSEAQNDENQKSFSIKFDNFEKTVSVINRSNNKLNESKPNEIAFKIRIFSKAGITKKDIVLNGNDDGNSDKLNELNGYHYNEGDTIELWSSNPSKGIKIIGNIQKDHEISEDYNDGIQDNNFMNNVRFELQANTLYAKYNDAPSIKFKTDLTIKRGENFDPLKFIYKVEDDHDNINTSLVRASYNKDKIHQVGEHAIEYKVSDKWGRSHLETKNIKVLPKNELEETKIKLMKEKEDGTKEPILTLYFDDINKTLVKDFIASESISGESDTDAFKIRIFDSSNELKAESIIKANESLSSDSLQAVIDEGINYNDIISIEAYNYDKVSIEGDILANHKNSKFNEIYKNGFTDDDKMKNTRFRVTSDGLKELYNEAPEFHGVENTSILKRDEFDNLDGVSVTDDHDVEIPNSNIEVVGQINPEQLGPQTLIYKVSDSWGRSTQKTRTVTVKSKATNNEIELKDTTNNIAFKIGFDFVNNKFTLLDQSSTQINSSNTDSEFFIFIADRNNRYVKHVDLKGTDTGNSPKLEELKQTTIRVGYKFFVWSNDSTKLSIKGDIIKGDGITEESYDDGINSSEFMTNVSFVVTEDGLKAVYNKAPVINVPNDSTDEGIILYKGDDYRKDLLNNVTISDDHDTIDKEDIDIKVERISVDGTTKNGRFELSDVNDIGMYKAIYTVNDSWTRKSLEVERYFKVVPSIDRNEIWFGGHIVGTGDIESMFKIKFNSDNMNINVTDKRSDKLNNGASSSKFYEINVYGNDGQKKIDTITLSTNDTGQSSKLDRLNNLKFAYGDYITIYAYQTFRMKIKGPVRNSVERDSDGYEYVNSGDDFINTKFYITEEGLKSEYINPVNLSEVESLIEYDGGEGKPFKIKINHETGDVQYPQTGGFYQYSNQGVVFTLKWHRVNGDVRTFTYRGRDSGVGNELKDYIRNNPIEDGDYLTFETNYHNRIRIHGALSKNNDEDYSDGISSSDNLQNTRFYLRKSETDKHIRAEYNKAPEFNGVEDKNIYVGDSFDPTENVTVTDDHDTPKGSNRSGNSGSTEGSAESGGLTYTYSGNYQIDRVGKYPYTYRVTDSWGRSTTVTRNVYVRPAIFKNRIMLYAKEETTNQSDINPAFEIGVDNDTGKYTVSNQLDKALNPSLDEEVTFKIAIYGNDGNKKAKLELNGSDTGTSTKLDDLKRVDYSGNDYIRIWSAEPKYLRITGPINQDLDLTENRDSNVDNNGSVEYEINGNEDYNNGIDNEDKMKNVAFKLTDDEMSTIYNQAPQFKGLNSTIEILFGDNSDLLKDVTISDDKDINLTTRDVTTTGTVDREEIGSYLVTHTVTDSWGRSTSQEVRYKVVSKIKQNSIEVYGSSSNSGRNTNNSEGNANEKKFTLTFNTDTNKIDVNINNSINAKTASSDIPEETKKDFEIVVRNRDTGIKAKVSLNENEMTSEALFNELKAITLSNGDTISLYNKNKSNIKIKGHIEKSNDKDFSNHFPNDLEFENVRFKVTNKGLELFEHETPVISFNTQNLTVIRGNKDKLYEGISFGFNNSDSILGINVEIKDFDILNLGTQNAKYVVTDSWGTKVEKTRQITVTERNELEKNKIKLLNSTSRQELFEFGFDTLENKIVPKKIAGEYTGIDASLLTLKVYDETGVTKDIITITSNNIDSFTEKLEFTYGDLVSISAYDRKNGLSIAGNIKGQKENYLDGVDSEDNIVNVRFKISENGLESVYNNAPELSISNDISVFKNESPDLYQGISIRDTDSHDKEISVNDVQIETDLDVTRMGEYAATYTVIDSWGRESRPIVRNIEVKSSLENTTIEYYSPGNNGNDSDFYISINNKNDRLEVTKNYTKSKFRFNKSKYTEGTIAQEERIFEVNLYSKDAEIKKSLTILSNDTSENVTNKLNDFNNTKFLYGDYISVYSKDYENGIKINGNIKKSFDINEDYSDGIQNPDFMNNVRFRITEEEFNAIYNNQPTMKIPEGVLEHYKGDNIYIGKDILVRDDMDININNRTISIPESEKIKLDTIGRHNIDIVVTDSWGRSTQGTRMVEVKNSIDRNEIWFGGHIKGTGGIESMFKIKFDSNTNQIKVTDQRSDKLNNEADASRYYEINVYNQQGQKQIETITLGTSDRGNSDKLNRLNNHEFEYGDYINIYAYQTFRIKINGEVRNGREDYSDGINRGEDFVNTNFHITDKGLVAEYINPTTINENESLIEFAVEEGKVLKMKINHDNGEITFLNGIEGFYDWHSGDTIVFKLSIHKASNNQTQTFSYRGKDQGPLNELTNFARNNHLQDGDYIRFETPHIPLNKSIQISGKLIKPENSNESIMNEDYSDGIDNIENMTKGIFYYNKNGEKGITVEHLGSATIEGADDISILQGSDFDTRTNVVAKEYDGSIITNQLQVDGDVNTSRIGMYEVKYSVTNRNDIKTEVYRNVRVYSEATITLKDQSSIPYIEQGTSETDITDYLKTLVQANDPDGNQDLTDRVEVDISQLEPEKPGTYNVTYSVTNDFDKTSTLNVNVNVGRSIGVSVPIKIPFQVVTNLLDKEADPFISGVLKIKNDRTSEVDVSVKSFTKESNSGDLQIVDPNSVNWEELSKEDSMTKMALGMYVKSGINGKTSYIKETPLWLVEGQTNEVRIGMLPRAERYDAPYEAKIGFTSKHGKNFMGGTSKGKFNLVFKFE